MGQVSHDAPTSHIEVIAGYAATFLLAIYGGFFSGGYVTMLTAAFVLLFGMTFLQAVATTKVINVFSSGVATLVFVWRGVVDLRLGIVLGAFMFLGALLGARIALFLSKVWLRRIFIAAVVGLASSYYCRCTRRCAGRVEYASADHKESISVVSPVWWSAI